MSNLYGDNRKQVNKKDTRKDVLTSVKNAEDNKEVMLTPVVHSVVVKDVEPGEDFGLINQADKTSQKIVDYSSAIGIDEFVQTVLNDTPPGRYAGRKTKKQLNMLSSPYFVAFLKHLTYKENGGRTGKVGTTSLAEAVESTLILHFIKSGEMESLIEGDEILQLLYDRMVLDMKI